MSPALVFVLACAISAALCHVIRRAAIGHGAVVPFRSDRWHNHPTPTYGGIAIAGGTVASVAVMTLVVDAPFPWVPAAMVLAAAVVMFAVGLVDDGLQLTPLAKLLASLATGSFLLYGLSTQPSLPLTWWQTVLLIIWYAGVVHAFNLLDNMDGLAAGVALIATLALVFLFGTLFRPYFTAVLMGFAGAAAGFLAWNVKPARLFMGDCGSLFLGATVAGATLILLIRPDSRLFFDWLVVGLLLVVPLLDTTFVLVLRRLAGRGVTRGGTDHLSHRLVSAGLTDRTAVATLYVLGLAGAATAWFSWGDGLSSLPVAVLFGVCTFLLAGYLARVPAYDGEDFRALQKSSFAPFLRDLTFRWHAIEMLLDVVLISIVFYLSYRIRFEGEQLAVFLPSFTASLPAVVGFKLLALHVSGAYSRLWGTFSLGDAIVLVRGVAIGSVGSVLLAAYMYRFERFSRGVFLIDAILLTLVLLVSRGAFRAMGEAGKARQPRARRLLIYGAGSGGQLLVREMRANADWGLRPVAFLDDDASKRQRRLMGIPIRGSSETVERVLSRYRIEEVVVSTPKVSVEHERAVREACARHGIPVRRFKLEITES